MAPADIEWVLGVVRAGRDYQGMDHAKAGGASYEFTATVIVRGNTAEIVGGAGRLTPALAKEIEIALHSHGITTAIWERFNGDPRRLVRATRGRSGKEEARGEPATADQAEEIEAFTSPAPSAPAHNGASLLGGSATFLNRLRPERDTVFAKPSGGKCARDMGRRVQQKVGAG